METSELHELKHYINCRCLYDLEFDRLINNINLKIKLLEHECLDNMEKLEKSETDKSKLHKVCKKLWLECKKIDEKNKKINEQNEKINEQNEIATDYIKTLEEALK